MEKTHCDINVTERGGVTTIELSGEFDVSAATEFDSTVHHLHEHPPEEVTIDLRNLTFIDSTGLRALIEAQMQLEAVGSAFCVIHRRGHVADILGLTGADRVLRLVEAPLETSE